MIMWSEN